MKKFRTKILRISPSFAFSLILLTFSTIFTSFEDQDFLAEDITHN